MVPASTTLHDAGVLLGASMNIRDKTSSAWTGPTGLIANLLLGAQESCSLGRGPSDAELLLFELCSNL
jgi:hypothetical protein